MSFVESASPIKKVARMEEIQWYYSERERVIGCEERRERERDEKIEKILKFDILFFCLTRV